MTLTICRCLGQQMAFGVTQYVIKDMHDVVVGSTMLQKMCLDLHMIIILKKQQTVQMLLYNMASQQRCMNQDTV